MDVCKVTEKLERVMKFDCGPFELLRLHDFPFYNILKTNRNTVCIGMF